MTGNSTTANLHPARLVAAKERGALPADLTSHAARRIGIAGLLFAFAYICFEILHSTLRAQQALANWRWFYGLAAISIGGGFLLYLVSRKLKDRPGSVIRIGLVFEVFASLAIALGETTIPFQPDDIVRGSSAVAIWISTFALISTAPFRLALGAALASAAMAPVAMAVNVWLRGNPNPAPGQWMIYCSAPFLMAILSSLTARWIYRLGEDLKMAQELGSYELIEALGKGGMGEVWRARHRFLARESAVKLISSNQSLNRVLLEKRFQREARAISRLECPHTVSIYDFGTTPSGQLYFAMELIRGLNLEQLVKRFGPQPPSRVRHILLGVLDSLEEAHRAGLTHRDIKPSNILLSRLGLEHDFVKVVDFGLVKSSLDGVEGKLTLDQQALGTPAFMPPEIARGDENRVDGRSDLYSLACVADWLLTGLPLFEGGSPMAIILKHLQDEPPTIESRRELPMDPGLESAIRLCLAKDPESRPASAAHWKAALLALDLPPWTEAEARRWWTTNMPDLAA